MSQTSRLKAKAPFILQTTLKILMVLGTWCRDQGVGRVGSFLEAQWRICCRFHSEFFGDTSKSWHLLVCGCFAPQSLTPLSHGFWVPNLVLFKTCNLGFLAGGFFILICLKRICNYFQKQLYHGCYKICQIISTSGLSLLVFVGVLCK